jgi:selenocysteine-specific translation elongation factor
MDGITVGVFDTDQEVKAAFESAVARKSEAEGLSVHTRTEGGRRYSFIDTDDFPGRIQGYSRIASFCDHVLYFFPKSGKLTPPDGELAVLLEAFGLPGTLEITDGTVAPDAASSLLTGTSVSQFPTEARLQGASSIELSRSTPRPDFQGNRTLVYIDRVFTVKGVGTVALGFVLSGTVNVHDQLRPIPGPPDRRVDVKGIQVNDVGFESAGRGLRVGLSLRGIEPPELEKSHWLDDGSFGTTSSPTLEFSKSRFYRLDIASRDLHLQLPGEMVTAHLTGTTGSELSAKLPWQIPTWSGMRTCILDLNGGNQRVAGGATVKF